jgi:hypothetical protein
VGPLEAAAAIVALKNPAVDQILNRSRRDKVSIDIQLRPGRQQVQLETDLLMEWPLTIEMEAALPAPLAAVLRDWMDKARSHRYLSSHLRALRGQLRTSGGTRTTLDYSTTRPRT